MPVPFSNSSTFTIRRIFTNDDKLLKSPKIHRVKQFLSMKQDLNNKFSFLGSEERIRKLINSLHVGILLQGPQTEILFSNETALNILGLTEDELYGSSSFYPDLNVVHEDGSSFPASTHPVPIAIKTKRSVSNVIMGVCRPGRNDRVWLLVNAEPFLDDNGEVKEVICI